MYEESTTHTVEADGIELRVPKRTLSELSVRSDEVQEIIGQPPHWLIRWGVTVFFSVLLLILLSTWFIEYPELIEAPMRLTAINAPVVLESKIEGRLTSLLVENNVQVDEGQVLAWIESNARHGEVLTLSSRIDSLKQWLLTGNLRRVTTFEGSNFSNLGTLQSDYQIFEQAYRDYLLVLAGGLYQRQKEALEQELEFSKTQLKLLQEQKIIRQSEYELAEKEYQMQRELANRELIAPIEIARNESTLLSYRLPLQQVESSIISNLVSQLAVEQEILQLDRQIDEQESVFMQAINVMDSAILEWKDRYLITSPFAGKVTYAGILQENQNMISGQEIFYVDPGNSDFFGELTVRQQSFGKIQLGQKVLIRFSGYPYHEYGTVEGRVDYISEFPVRDSIFVSKVAFPDDLNTSYGLQIPARNGLTGQAEIITQDLKIIERIINNFLKEFR